MSLLATFLTLVMNLIPGNILISSIKKSYLNNPQITSTQVTADGYAINNWNDCIAMQMGAPNYNPVYLNLFANKVFSNVPCDINLQIVKGSDVRQLPYYDYSRYWHGYSFISKPIFAIFDWNTVRSVFFYILLSSLFLLWNTIKKFTSTYYALIVSPILLLTLRLSELSYGITTTTSISAAIFCAVAIVNSSTDNYRLFTSRITLDRIALFAAIYAVFDALGSGPFFFTLTLYLLHLKAQKLDITYRFLDVTKLLIFLFIPYVVTWAFRWLLYFIFHPNLNNVSQFLSYMRWRSQGNGDLNEKITLFKGLTSNLEQIVNFRIAIGIIGMIILSSILQRIKYLETNHFTLKGNFGCYFLNSVVFAIVWYVGLKQQSAIHNSFVYRGLIPILLLLIPTKIKIKSRIS